MKKIFSIIGLAKTLFFVLFLFANSLQSQDWIKDYPGIPIETEMHEDWITYNYNQVLMMKDAGIDFVRMGINAQWVVDSLKHIGLKLLSFDAFNQNWVQYYTDAKYSVWEADAPLGKGDAKLYHNTSKCSVIANSYLRLNNSAASDSCKMIWGPYHVQDINYYTKSLNGTFDTVEYTSEFQLKLENIGPDTANFNTPLCVIQVTQSKCSSLNVISCTDTIVEKVLKRGDFTSLNQFIKHSLINYPLLNSNCDNLSDNQFPQPLTPHNSGLAEQNSLVPIVAAREYIEYRVIWLGHPSYVLSIDSIIVSDLRGRELLNSSSLARDRIEAQADAYGIAFTDSVTGWLGFDEPASIDLYEPIKIVRNILDNASNPQQKRSLWLPWRAFWDGAFESRGNTLGAMGLIPWVEFGKRVGRVNVIQNSYLFDLPCNESVISLDPCKGDWKDINIWHHTNLMYKPAYELDPYYGVSLQCGEIDPPYENSYQRDIRRHEFLYTANLALMYGAKFLSLYTYFAQEPYLNPTIFTYRAIVEFPHYPITNAELTDKYFALRDTLSPRLKGLFGKTLKKLTPDFEKMNLV